MPPVINAVTNQFIQVGPYWLVDLTVGSFVSVYLSQRIVNRLTMFQNGSFSLISIAAASILGAASPMCMYGTIPLIAALGKRGVAQCVLVAFMVSSILLNPNVFLMTFALGASEAVWRLGFCLAAGVLAGILAWPVFKGRNIFDFTKFETKASGHDKTFFRDLGKAARITGPYFGLIIFITSLMEIYIPRSWTDLLFSIDRNYEVGLSIMLSVPVYTCDGAMIPLLRTWQEAGLSGGSVAAFMLAGSATKLGSLGALKLILGFKNFFLYLVFVLAFAFLAGVLINIVG